MINKSNFFSLFHSQLKYSTILLFIILFYACSSKKEATVSAGDALEQITSTIRPDTFSIDVNASVTTWIASRPNRKHNGIIPITAGTIFSAENEITGGKITMALTALKIKDLEADADSHLKLKGHLMSADFFLADSFPVAVFDIIQITPFDSAIQIVSKEEFEAEFKPESMSAFMVENPTHWVTGNLTMRGTVRSISFPSTITFSADKISAEARFNIDRTDWGLMYQDESSVLDKAKDRFIYNTINVGFYIKAVK